MKVLGFNGFILLILVALTFLSLLETMNELTTSGKKRYRNYEEKEPEKKEPEPVPPKKFMTEEERVKIKKEMAERNKKRKEMERRMPPKRLPGGKYMDDEMREYANFVYGPDFKVDESYPLTVSKSEYAFVKRGGEYKPKNQPIEYPEKLWIALIHTMPARMDNINKTRNTWCKEEYQKKYNFRCVFILVESTVLLHDKYDVLMEMNKTHHDIYFIEMPGLMEQWETLQLKNIDTYIMALNTFPGYHYYTRVDDNIFVTVDMLNEFLIDHLERPTVVGQLYDHRPQTDHGKYHDQLAANLPNYFLYPSGFFSMFTRDIIEFIATRENYHIFAPSSLEDPGFGHWIYKFSKAKSLKVDILTPPKFGGNDATPNGDFIVYHSDYVLDQQSIYNRRIASGRMRID